MRFLQRAVVGACLIVGFAASELSASVTIVMYCGSLCGPARLHFDSFDQVGMRSSDQLTVALLDADSSSHVISSAVGQGFELLGPRFVLTEADEDELVTFTATFHTSDDLSEQAEFLSGLDPSQLEYPFLPSVRLYSDAPVSPSGPAVSPVNSGIVSFDVDAGTVEWRAVVPASTLIGREVFGMKFDSLFTGGVTADGFQSLILRIGTAGDSGVFRALGVPEPSAMTLGLIGGLAVGWRRHRVACC